MQAAAVLDHRVARVEPTSMNFVDSFLWESGLLRQAIMILLYPTMNQTLSSEKAERMMCERGWRLARVALPTNLVLSRQRCLANNRSRDASTGVNHGLSRDAHQSGKLGNLRCHHGLTIFELSRCQPFWTCMVLARGLVRPPNDLWRRHRTIISAAMHKERIVMPQEFRPPQSGCDCTTHGVLFRAPFAGLAQHLRRFRGRILRFHWLLRIC
mmetsp:Transcript_126897/g.317113  ORF Transcript_126897/g.317113 Transcript_126897/m.317113 type:complete len:212 (-) Transcript_126897:519-1154(-)